MKKTRILHIFALVVMLVLIVSNARGADRKWSYPSFAEAMELYQRERFPDAAKLFTKTLEEAEKNDDPHMAIICNGYIANIYASYGDYHRSLYYLEKGYNGAVRTGDSTLMAHYTTNLVNAYCRLGDMPKAKEFFKRQFQFNKKNMGPDWEYYIVYNNARIARAENRLDEAVKYHKEALQVARNKHLGKLYELFQYSEIGNIYLKQGHYADACRMGRECMGMADGLKSRELIANAAQMLAESYKYLNKPDSAAYFKKLYTATSDSVYNLPNLNRATTQLFEYENKQTDNTINSLHHTVNKQWWIIVVIAVLLILTASLSVLLLRFNHKLRNTQKLLINRSKELQREESTTKKLRENTVLKDQQDILLTRIGRVLDDMEVISNPDFTLTKLAEMINSNTSYVSSVINDAYGKNFKTLLNERRINEAAKRLTDENYQNQTIQAIYESVGYRNSVSFLRAFKKIYGMTPSEYQKLENQ